MALFLSGAGDGQNSAKNRMEWQLPWILAGRGCCPGDLRRFPLLGEEMFAGKSCLCETSGINKKKAEARPFFVLFAN